MKQKEEKIEFRIPEPNRSHIHRFLLGGLLLTPAAFGAASVKLSPAFGPPTTKTKVFGEGFPANVAIKVYFDATEAAHTTSSAQGAFSVAVAVPAAAQPGTPKVQADAQAAGIAVKKSFWLRPTGRSLALSPAAGAATPTRIP
jgi:hypothetical protein